MAYENILTERQDGTAIIRLNRPQALNALNNALIAELCDALDGFEAFLRTKLDARTADREKENASLQAAIDEVARKNQEKMQANLQAIAAERERFASWQARKRIEENKLFEAVGPFVEKNPVTVGNSTSDSPQKGGPNEA